jgi:hypothetical protein
MITEWTVEHRKEDKDSTAYFQDIIMASNSKDQAVLQKLQSE